MLAFSGAAEARESEGGFTIDLCRRGQQIEVITPELFERRYRASAPDYSDGLRLAALRFSGPALVPGREAAMGAMLEFEPSG